MTVLIIIIAFYLLLECLHHRHLIVKLLTFHQDHEWVTAGGKESLPSEQENCRLVEVTDEDMAQVVTSIPNLSTLILIKTMLKKHSFQVSNSIMCVEFF